MIYLARRLFGLAAFGRGSPMRLEALPHYAESVLRPSGHGQLPLLTSLYQAEGFGSPSPWLMPMAGSSPAPLASKSERRIKAVVDGSKWQFCTLGVWLPGCSVASERPGEAGYSALFARLAQTCTAKSGATEWNNRWSLALASSLHVVPSRDGLFMGCLVAPEKLPEALDALMEAVLFPALEPSTADQKLLTETRDIEMRRMVEETPDVFMQELLYLQMFSAKGLGNSILAQGEAATQSYGSFCAKATTGMVVGLSGGHFSADDFAQMLSERSGGLEVVLGGKEHPVAPIESVGSGPLFIEDSCFGESFALASANRWHGKTHFIIGWPTGPSSCIRQATVPQALTAAMLGGGSAFSAGGPGKGLYSRLYCELLNRYAWIEDAHCMFQSHSTAGWLGIYLAVEQRWAPAAVEIAIRQLVRLHCAVDDVQWRRSKNRLKSMLLMGIESRLAHLEALLRARMTLSPETHFPDGLLHSIDAFSLADLRQFRDRLLGKGRMLPTLAAAGEDLSAFPTFSDSLGMLEAALARA
ncbi:Mitochondrial-processing peptidase subunit alpha [Mitosporidium daphniae]